MCSLSEPLTSVTESSPSPVGYACFQMVFLNTVPCVQTCVYKCVCANAILDKYSHALCTVLQLLPYCSVVV